jgi:uncharacterized membrane protein
MSQGAFWREEIWHPLTVHFPIALLLFATIIWLTALLLKNKQRHNCEISGSLLLFAGSLTAWVSIYTGDIADGAVAQNLCDPTILKSHEIASYTMAYLFTAASLLNLILILVKLRDQYVRILKYGLVLVMLFGSGYLTYGAHLGATLVYQQGAGVHKPSADCSGF